MLDKIKNYVNLAHRHKFLLAFLIVLASGVFLRTYNFSEWLTFNSDQARDATVVKNMIEKNEIPLLGPVAGGTQFRLGPAFYYFQFLAAKILGVTPDKMAYADLFFGILAIPLTYLLARRFFLKDISLILMAFYAASAFAIQYSRFAWNTNSAQFFVALFIYSIIKISESRGREFGWIILAGISMGVGVQLHTLLLFGIPFAFFLLSAYLLKNKLIKIHGIAIIISVALLLNITQIIYELRTNGANFREFRNALIYKSDDQNSLWKNALFVVSCQAQSHIKILAPYANQEKCDFPLADKYFKRLEKRMSGILDWLVYAAKITIVLIFSGGSCWLFYEKIKGNKESLKRNSFLILALFGLSVTAVFVPFGAEISLRYFILLIPITPILLGLWLEFLMRKREDSIRYFSLAAVFILIGYNIFFCMNVFRDYSRNIPGNMINGTAKQASEMADYLIKESFGSKKIQIAGQEIYLGRFYNRVSFFANDRGFELIQLNSDGDIVDATLPLFYIINEMSGECKVGEFYKYGYIENCKKMFDVAILKLSK